MPLEEPTAKISEIQHHSKTEAGVGLILLPFAGLGAGLFAGFIFIIIGILLSLTIIGVIIGIPLIILGILMMILGPISGISGGVAAAFLGRKAPCPYCQNTISFTAYNKGVSCRV